MAHLTTSVEYGIHCLLWLVDAGDTPLSTRDLAELQGVSPTFLAKIFPKLEKAGIVAASEGVRGGYRLAKAPEDISFLEIVDALEGDKPLFDCQQIRGRCAVFEGNPPSWAMAGVCAIHAVMLRAEKAMRDTLAKESLADVAKTFGRKAPPEFTNDVQKWIEDRLKTRASTRKSRTHEEPS
jgi:Rrf2 family protein